MINPLVGLAVVVFFIWLLLALLGAVAGGLVHVLWIVILASLAIWAYRYQTGGRRRGGAL